MLYLVVVDICTLVMGLIRLNMCKMLSHMFTESLNLHVRPPGQGSLNNEGNLLKTPSATIFCFCHWQLFGNSKWIFEKNLLQIPLSAKSDFLSFSLAHSHTFTQAHTHAYTLYLSLSLSLSLPSFFLSLTLHR